MSWIKVTDKMPDCPDDSPYSSRSEYVLIATVIGVSFAQYNGTSKEWEQEGASLCMTVTHWQPLPDPPSA